MYDNTQTSTGNGSETWKTIRRFQTVLDDEFEAELVKYVIDMQRLFHGLSSELLRRLANDLADKNGIRHPFRNLQRWKRLDFGFPIYRHPKLSFRIPIGNK